MSEMDFWLLAMGRRILKIEKYVGCGIGTSCLVLLFFPCRECNKEMLDDDSVSPLLLSVKCGKAAAVKALIEAGCNIRTIDKDAKSVIYWAAQEGHLNVLKVRLLTLHCLEWCYVWHTSTDMDK